MAVDLRSFSITVPARTPIANPLTVQTPLGQYKVSSVEVVVPPGPNGNVGFRFTSGGGQILPTNLGGWIIASGEKISWGLADQITTGAWAVTIYNTGIYDHTIQVRYLLDLLGADAGPPGDTTIPIAAIMGGLDGVTAGSGVDA